MAFQNKTTDFTDKSYKGTPVLNAINIATVNYADNTIEVGKAENLTIEINGILPFVSVIALVNDYEDVKVFEYQGYSEGKLTVSESSGYIIPANKPVILKSETAGEYTFNFINDENSYEYSDVAENPNGAKSDVFYLPDVTDGILRGALMPHLIPDNGYGFDGEKFVQVQNNKSQNNYELYVVLGFSCYITLPSETEEYPESISISFLEEEEESNSKEGYYLGGALTAKFEDDPNPSYKFAQSEDGTYTLEVASIPSGTTFYVLYSDAEGELTYYGASSTSLEIAQYLQPELSFDLTEGEENAIALGSSSTTPASYLNLTFTLKVEDGSPVQISYVGTEGSSVNGVSVTVGNDKTTQSGTISGNNIVIDTQKAAATLFIYVPTDSKDVQYALANVVDIPTATGLTTYADLPDDLEWQDAPESTYEDGAYEVTLPTGKTGQLYVKYTNADEQEVATETPYNFTVNENVSTAVELVDADLHDAAIYNVFGQKVDETYKGIVIKNGKKYIQR